MATAEKKATTRKRSPKSTDAAIDAPKLTKTQKDLVAKAIRLGLDVDPMNFDVDALKSGVAVVEAANEINPGTPVAIAGPLGDEFERGEFVKVLRSGAVRVKNDMGSVEIPVDMIGAIRVVEAEPTPSVSEKRAKPKAAPKSRRGAIAEASTEARAPREGSGLWAALEVLKKARTPMTGADVYAKIKERKLAPNLKGKTPEATITAALNVAAARGQHGIVRPEPGRFSVAKAGR